VNEQDPPESARLIRDFINSYEPQTEAEAFSTPDSLRDWFAGEGLLRGDTRLTARDLEQATTIREGLRSVLQTHAGHDADPGLVRALNDALAEVPLRVTFADDGHHVAAAEGVGLHEAIGRLMDAVRRSTEDQSWRRLKVCDRDTCRWAFYDSSRNRTRRWCSMAGCGNYVKMRRRSSREPDTAGEPR
jgi:predicted RNA-binding Zn ribbon-like protein